MIPPFEQEYAKIEKPLFLVAVSYTHNTEDARDALADAALAAFKSYGKLRKPEYFKTWMTRIVINKCLDLLKSRHTELELSDQLQLMSAQPTENVELLDAVCRLGSDVAPYITLRFYAGLNYEETAKTLGVPVSTAKYRTQKALEALKIMLEVTADE